jgi:hypothetical protein
MLMHSVVFVIAPLIIARLLSSIFIDANKFTNEEQEQINFGRVGGAKRPHMIGVDPSRTLRPVVTSV